jgi:hypothetical protein
MQERTVLILVVVLVVATAGAGVAVNAFRSSDSGAWHAFFVTLDWQGNPAVGSQMQITVRVRQGQLDSRTLPAIFLSLDVSTLAVASATPGKNPWGYPTVWNLTGVDFSSPRVYNVTAAPTETGSTTLYAMVWVPLGDLRSVSVDSVGHVNPADISLMAADSAVFTVTAAA